MTMNEATSPDVRGSVNPAFRAFVINLTNITTLRQFLPGMYGAIADLVAGVLPDVLLAMSPPQLRPYLSRVEGGPQIAEDLKASLPQTIGEKPIVVLYRQVVDRFTLIAAAFMADSYFLDTFKEIIRQHPDWAPLFDGKGSAKQKFDDGVYDTFEEALVRVHHRDLNFQAPEKIELAYRKLGIACLTDPALREELAAVFAERHLIVHRGGIVTSEHVRKVGSQRAGKVGEPVGVTPEKSEAALGAVCRQVFDVEKQLLDGGTLTGEPVLATISPEVDRRVREAMSAYKVRG